MLFNGVNGHTYGFFSVAQDNVGITQPLPSSAQATILVDSTAPILTSVVSRKLQGGSNMFDLPLSPGGTATIEPRLNGPATVVFTFSNNIAVAGGTPTGSNFSISNGTFGSALIADNILTLNLSGILNQSVITVGLSGITDAIGNPLVGVFGVSIRTLYGDVNQSGSVSVSDLQGVKNHLLEPMDASTPRQTWTTSPISKTQ